MASIKHYSLMLCLCLCLCQVPWMSCERGVSTTWGFLRPANSIQTIISHETKSGIILLTRSLTIAYPEYFLERGEQVTAGPILGIRHVNLLDDDKCRPYIHIASGGVEQERATVEITSERGCGIDSIVEFVIDDDENLSMYNQLE